MSVPICYSEGFWVRRFVNPKMKWNLLIRNWMGIVSPMNQSLDPLFKMTLTQRLSWEVGWWGLGFEPPPSQKSSPLEPSNELTLCTGVYWAPLFWVPVSLLRAPPPPLPTHFEDSSYAPDPILNLILTIDHFTLVIWCDHSSTALEIVLLQR